MRAQHPGSVVCARRALRALLPLALAGAGILTAHAVPQSLPPDLRACAQEKEDAQRLACYDRTVARYSVAPIQTFGLAPEAARKVQHIEAAPEEPKSLSAKVTRIAHEGHGALVVTLDNGQTWVQQQPADFPVDVGDTVTVKRGALGSYFLYAPSGRATRMNRAQ